MDFTFNQDQQMFTETLAALLAAELPADRIRQRWQSDSGIDAALAAQLVELGLPAMLVPEALGGLGLDATDFIQLAECCGRFALPEPAVEGALVAAPLLVDIIHGNPSAAPRLTALLEELMAGEAAVAVGHHLNPYVNFAGQADWFLLGHGNAVHLLPASEVAITAVKSVDPSRRLGELAWRPSAATLVADAELGAACWRATLNRGALGNAAQLLGLADAMVKQAVAYSADRQQFGKPIGVNQAVKHLLADCAVQIEFARAPVYRAAYTVAQAATRADWAVSHAKVVAGEAAQLAARNSIQVFGAMGYTWECDLQIWAKRGWVLDREWGDAGFHKNRVHEWLVQPNALIGPEYTFGRGDQPHAR
ncbi:acyl-CoA dehydrogenase [Gammaproteobacteria bacterium LSUCC0057]|uniref:Acyl-CoA dehydrogenase n=1 Tax=Gammaproteobacteria bacterium LSUCC0057 TaxID=2559237 RepID=A0A4Y8UM72_9GAMM|nr:acyl-CoA dehydrogenase [Gammaproteobacteria bacterium LSUCC0057]